MPTLIDGQILTGAHMQIIRDNFAETAPAKFTAAGQLFVSTGSNVGAARTISSNKVTGGSQSTTSTSFTDLTTTGPTLSNVTTGTSALVIVTSFISNSTADQGGSMSYSINGAAVAIQALRLISSTGGANQRASAFARETGLTAGTNTFTSKYAVIGSGTASFDEREIAIIPL